jgi:hypothetical protein
MLITRPQPGRPHAGRDQDHRDQHPAGDRADLHLPGRSSIP